jgi:hypothetical protein
VTQVLENAAAALHCSWTARVDPTDALTQLLNNHVAHVEQLKDSQGASELTAACPERRLERRHPDLVLRFEAVPTYHTSSQAFIGPPEVRAARMTALEEAFARTARILQEPDHSHLTGEATGMTASAWTGPLPSSKLTQ